MSVTPPPGTVPPAEVTIDEGLVRGLLADQHPTLADLPLELVSHGWDNDTYRLGNDLAVRLPRRAVAAPLIRNEQRWLPVLAEHVPVAVPVPVHVGGPGRGYPWHWSVVPWIEGARAEHEPLDPDAAGDLGSALAAVHAAPVPDDPPHNEVRGVPLEHRRASLVDRLARLRGSRRARHLLAEAERAFEVAARGDQSGRRGWLHGDPHPRNVLTRHGRLAGLIDWGDVCVGDQATDLAAPWMHLPLDAHDGFWSAYEAAGGVVADAVRARARGWAAFFGVVLLDVGDDDEGFASIGTRTLERVAAGAA